MQLFCELRLKEAEIKSTERSRETAMLMWQKTIYLKVFLQKVFEITIRSSPARLKAASRGIPHDVDIPGLSNSYGSYRNTSSEVFNWVYGRLNSSFDPSRRNPYIIDLAIWQTHGDRTTTTYPPLSKYYLEMSANFISILWRSPIILEPQWVAQRKRNMCFFQKFRQNW